MGPGARVARGRASLVSRPRPAHHPDGRQVDGDGPLGGRHRRHHADRNRGGGAHEHPGVAAHSRAGRPRYRSRARSGGGRDRRVAAAAPRSPGRCHRPAADWRLVDPSARWDGHLGPVVLPRPHLPFDVDHRSLAQLVRAALAQADARLDPGRRSFCDQHFEHSDRPERIRAGDAGADVGAAAVDQLHRLDRQRDARQGQAHGRRAMGLLGERTCGDGRAHRPRHHAATLVDGRPNA